MEYKVLTQRVRSVIETSGYSNTDIADWFTKRGIRDKGGRGGSKAVSPSTVANYRQGKADPPQWFLRGLAEMLGLPTEWYEMQPETFAIVTLKKPVINQSERIRLKLVGSLGTSRSESGMNTPVISVPEVIGISAARHVALFCQTDDAYPFVRRGDLLIIDPAEKTPTIGRCAVVNTETSSSLRQCTFVNGKTVWRAVRELQPDISVDNAEVAGRLIAIIYDYQEEDPHLSILMDTRGIKFENF